MAPKRPRRVFDDVAGAIGDTPLVRLGKTFGPTAEVYAKLEFTNPGGSIKDRVARYLVQAAAADGRLSPGDTIVEASSGNTAMGLAMMARLGGYRCRFTVRDRTSPEKLKALKALGAQLDLVDASLPPSHPESYNRAVDRLVRETPRAYFPDQHNNRENNAAHYESTGPEIWDQMEGRIDCFVAGVGTGGTISGVARYLKERDPAIQVIGVDPAGSVFAEYFRTGRLPAPGSYLLEGLGDEELIHCVEWDLIDDMIQVDSGEAFRATRRLAEREAIFAGGSSGAALWALEQIVPTLPPGSRVVTLFPDSGRSYLSTIYDDGWMRAQGFLPDEAQAA
ncbi:MAG: cysteine synthase family protein [Planctomycetes bacterium]|nr:cysteine synthase family protein [Planctomycetota bacterium]